MALILPVCKGCNQEKDDDDFYRHAAMANGRLSFCKECVKARVKVHRKANVERVRAYDRERMKLPHKKARLTVNTAEWRKENPEKHAAHIAARRIPLTKVCEKCGGEAKHRHHPDYSRPTFVMFLCVPCHSAEHHK